MKFAFYKTSKPENVKVIEVRTIRELMNLVDNTGQIVIGNYLGNYTDVMADDVPSDSNEPRYFIEDYDDYRE